MPGFLYIQYIYSFTTPPLSLSPFYFVISVFLLFQDEDPYVRKTAAVCVAKLHDINSTLVEDQGFLDLLKELLSDSVPMVSL